MTALTMIRKARATLAEMIGYTRMVIDQRLSMADDLREVLRHIELAAELHGPDQDAELQRAANRTRALLVRDLQADDIEPALEMRRSYDRLDSRMSDYEQNLSDALACTGSDQTSPHVEHGGPHVWWKRITTNWSPSGGDKKRT